VKVNAKYDQEVFIDPKKVIKNLQKEALPRDSWTFEEGGKFYIVEEYGCGSGHSKDLKTEISKTKFNYIEALNTVPSFLEFV